MARVKKYKDVAKFGGTEQLGTVQVDGTKHETATAEALSQTTLESDTGYGSAAIIRCFTFSMNPETFKENPPTKQELFNAHLKGIEVALWRDGLKVMPEIAPQLNVRPEVMQYQIFIGAVPQKGHTLTQEPQTLTQIAHG